VIGFGELAFRSSVFWLQVRHRLRRLGPRLHPHLI
jgi:hypothetical protein